ncbi:MAG: YDG domain-containing protein, partial [Gammaproteobacteria bacterium]|nr:YDG domain-containing protein [Gammaproteobacteria bacterium]
DASTAATLTNTGSLSGVLGSDTVSLDVSAVTAAFADKNVGTGKTVTASDYALTGADAGNYIINSGANTGTTTANITAANLTIAGIIASNKVYDTTTGAILTNTGSLSGVLGSDTVSLDVSAVTAAFADKNVGTGKTVTASDYALTGADAGNYVINSGANTGTTTANITAANLTIAGIIASNKVYDTTTGAILTNTGSLSGVLGSDTVSLDATSVTAAFADKNVGTGKTVTASDYALTGADAGNYVINSGTNTGTTTANITAANLTIADIIASNKVYDASTAATLTNTGSLSGVLGSDTVSLDATSVTAAFADKNVGTGKTVTASDYALTGADAGNYVINSGTNTGTTTANITAANLTIAGIIASNKVYDTTTGAILTNTGSLSGVLGSDTVSLDATSVTAAFADKNVGTGKTVTASDYALTGADAGNYVINSGANTGTTTANITAANLTIAGIIASNKVYDTTTGAILTNTGSLSGVLGSDTVSLDVSAVTAAFADKNVGAGKTVTASDYALTGTDAGNYVINSGANTGTTTANITAANLTIAGIVAMNKVYDASTAATLTNTGSLSGVLGSDTVSLNATLVTAAFNDENVGTAKSVTASNYSLSGADSGNYMINNNSNTGTSLANITARPITLLASDQSRTYGAANPTIGGFSLSSGTLAGTDALNSSFNVTSPATLSSNVGSYALTGNSASFSSGLASNYAISYSNGTLNINQAALTITADNASRLVSTPNPTFTASYSGLLNGDSASVVTGLTISTVATIDSPTGDYPIVPANGVALNYSISFVNGILSITGVNPTPTPIPTPESMIVPSIFSSGFNPAVISKSILDTMSLVPNEVPEYFYDGNNDSPQKKKKLKTTKTSTAH